MSDPAASTESHNRSSALQRATARIVSAYLQHNPLDPSAVPALISSVYANLAEVVSVNLSVSVDSATAGNSPQTHTRDDFLRIARVAHEVNRAYCAARGDLSQPRWEDAPHWQRDSAILGVRFQLANPDATPQDSHNAWLAEKVEKGWRYGPAKNAEKREHPCLVPFEQLPYDQRVKDYLFCAVVHALRV